MFHHFTSALDSLLFMNLYLSCVLLINIHLSVRCERSIYGWRRLISEQVKGGQAGWGLVRPPQGGSISSLLPHHYTSCGLTGVGGLDSHASLPRCYRYYHGQNHHKRQKRLLNIRYTLFRSQEPHHRLFQRFNPLNWF